MCFGAFNRKARPARAVAGAAQSPDSSSAWQKNVDTLPPGRHIVRAELIGTSGSGLVLRRPEMLTLGWEWWQTVLLILLVALIVVFFIVRKKQAQ